MIFVCDGFMEGGTIVYAAFMEGGRHMKTHMPLQNLKIMPVYGL